MGKFTRNRIPMECGFYFACFSALSASSGKISSRSGFAISGQIHLFRHMGFAGKWREAC